MRKHAVILAGGKGTRLQSRLGDLPKPLIAVAGKPLLEHQIELLKRFDYQVTLLVGFRAKKISSFLSDRYGNDHDIICIEEAKPRGTAGAVLDALAYLPNTFLVMYGDTMLNVDLDRFLETHKQNSCDATLFLHPNDHPEDSDIVEVDTQNRIIAFHLYPHDTSRYYPNLVNAALYIVEKQSIQEYAHIKGELDFAKKIFPAMLAQGAHLSGYISPEYIKDVGTPKRIDQVDLHWKDGIIQKRSLDVMSPAVFLDRDGTLNIDHGHISNTDELDLITDTPEAVRRLNQSGYPVVLVTNQPVVARGDCDERTLEQIHQKLDTLLGREGAYIDRKYYCPHHPHSGFTGERPELKLVCDCRKPAPGMLHQAAKDMNIDLPNSWMIGDRAADIEAGSRAGTRTIRIRSQYDCAESLGASSDYEFHNLLSAVKFMLDSFPGMKLTAKDLAMAVKSGDRIVIGGLARSGKSTWASILREALEDQGFSVVCVSLDDWLLGNKRKCSDGVLSRYDETAIECFLKNMSSYNGTLEVTIPKYNKIERTAKAQSNTVFIDKSDVVIVEGVVGLLFDKKYFDHHIYVNCDEEARRELFHAEYLLRGYSQEKISNLYESRMIDETPLIVKSRVDASIELSGVKK